MIGCIFQHSQEFLTQWHCFVGGGMIFMGLNDKYGNHPAMTRFPSVNGMWTVSDLDDLSLI